MVVFAAVIVVNIDNEYDSTRVESLHVTRSGAEAVLEEIRKSPMWERQGIDTYVDEMKVEP